MADEAIDSKIATFAAFHKGPSDFAVRIEDFEWRVHSSVLAKESAFFRQACLGEFKESAERVLVLHDDCPWIVVRMLQWLYLEHEDEDEDEDGLARHSHSSTSPIEVAMRQGDLVKGRDTDALKPNRATWQTKALLYQMADKYAIDGLFEELQSSIPDELQKYPAVFWDLIDYLGMFSLEKDETLCHNIFRKAFIRTPNHRELYEKLEDKFGRGSAMIGQVGRYLALDLADTQRRLHEAEDLNYTYAAGIENLSNVLLYDPPVPGHPEHYCVRRELEDLDASAIEEARGMLEEMQSYGDLLPPERD